MLRHSIQSLGVHHDHDLSIPADEHDDMLQRGRRSLGDLGYSLLRSDVYTKAKHRRRRVRSLVRDRDSLERHLALARTSDNATAIRHAERDLSLLVWEYIGVLGEFCEQLAALFHAVTKRSADSGDLGKLLVTFTKPAWRTLASEPFQDLQWWTSTLGVHDRVPDSIREGLTSQARALAHAMFSDARSCLTDCLDTVVHTYTQDVHRVAQKRKHPYPLVTEYGFEWLPTSTDEGVGFEFNLAEHSPFTVIDDSNGELFCLLVPGDRWAADRILKGIDGADWLLSTLSSAVLSAAENRTGHPLVWMPVARRWEWADHKALLRAYTGYSDAVHEGLLAERLAREDDLAKAGMQLADDTTAASAPRKMGRNEPCFCGSGRKFKRCHGITAQ